MKGIVAFFMTVTLALALWLAVERVAPRRSRRMLDRLRQFLPQWDESAREAPGRVNGYVMMPLGTGVRAIASVGCFGFLGLLNIHAGPDALIPIPPAYFWEAYTVVSLLTAWYLGYIWTYALMLEGHRLIVPTWAFGVKEIDLRRLAHIDDAGAFWLRLTFADGGKVQVIRQVRGRAALEQALERRRPS